MTLLLIIMTAAAAIGVPYLGTYLQSIELGGHGAHSPSQACHGLAILIHILAGQQLAELAQPLLLLPIPAAQQLLEAAQHIFFLLLWLLSLLVCLVW